MLSPKAITISIENDVKNSVLVKLDALSVINKTDVACIVDRVDLRLISQNKIYFHGRPQAENPTEIPLPGHFLQSRDRSGTSPERGVAGAAGLQGR